MCGDPWCPICGTLQGTYPEPSEPDPDAAYEADRQLEVDEGIIDEGRE